MITKFYSANLNAALEPTDVYLPLAKEDMTALVALLGTEGESIYLTLMDDMYREYVLATLTAGTVVLTRGIDSVAQKFPKGACVFFENSVPVTKWLICNFQCCADDCVPEAVAAQGVVSPPAVVGSAWTGSAIFSGGLPMNFGVTGMPSWMTATWQGNSVLLSGTPTVAGSYDISIAASNDRGANIAVQQLKLTVSAT